MYVKDILYFILPMTVKLTLTKRGLIVGAASGSKLIGVAAQGAFITSKSKVVKREVVNAAAEGKRARIILYDENPHS